MKRFFTYTIFTIIILIKFSLGARCQEIYQPYSFQFYEKFSDSLYSIHSRIHSSFKPFFIDDSLLHQYYQSLTNMPVKKGVNNKTYDRLLNHHLIESNGNGYTFYADLLPDLYASYDFSASKAHQTPWLATLGAQAGGTIGSKFSYYVSAYNSKANLPAYLNIYSNETGVIPGQTTDYSKGSNNGSWFYTTFLLSYTPVKYVNFTIGKDKNFVGDGYRSMLLSDFASNYPFFKINFELGNVRYMAMLAKMEDPNAPKVPGSNGARLKWGYFHYLDWNISNRVSIGFFDMVMSVDRDSLGHKRGIDPTYSSPFIFLRPVEALNNSPDKADIGFTGKWKVFNKSILYGQFALTEFQAKDFFSGNGSSRNKYGWQLGWRGADFLGVKKLNYLFEFNTAKPYTYTEKTGVENYSQFDEPLAHPLGANFREWLSIFNYSAGRFDLQGQFNYAYYGLDVNGLNYGKNIFESYLDPVHVLGNYTGQGLRTNFYYIEGRISYILNPKYNLRIEVGARSRNEVNNQFNNKTTMLSIGLRSSFRNIYTDF